MTVVVVDTSILMNVLDVRGYNQNRDAVIADFRQRIERNKSLILPLAAIIESGNHIARLSDGRFRRRYAERFAGEITKVVTNERPWVAARTIDARDIGRWIQDFPDHAMRELGLADVSIIDEYERQCELNPRRLVEIWALDHHLAGYRRAP